jgi:hypothetical protein
LILSKFKNAGMNKELYDIFKGLNETERSELRNKLKDSPVALRFYEYLGDNKQRNFKNREAVNYIYGADAVTPYPILENRYFKLRKKFFDEYLSPPVQDESILADEEKELMRCRQLIQKNEKDAACKALAALEKTCWTKNIFELLPAIIDNLIFCNQLLNKLEKNAGLYARMDKAVRLQSDCYKMISLARKVYEINFRKGVSHAKKELSAMKELGIKNKDFPRFELCYHHVSLYYKLGSAEYIEDMQVISRHYGKLRGFIRKFPELPLISYRKNYVVYQHMHYRQMTVFYHYNRCEFEEAYRMMKEFYELTLQQPAIYGLYKSESLFFNMFNNCRATFRFAEADRILDDYSRFLRENNNMEKLIYAYTLKAILFSEARPNKLGMEAGLLKEKLDEYLKRVKGENNVQTSYGEALVVKSRLYFIEGDFDKARQLIRNPEATSFLETFGLKDIFYTCYELFVKTKGKDAVERIQFRKKLSREIAVAKKPAVLIYLKWMQRITDSNKF